MSTVKPGKRFSEPVTETLLEHAVLRGRQRRRAGLSASGVTYLRGARALSITFADFSAISLPIDNYPELAALSEDELGRLALGFGGSAVCLDERDLHVSIAGLVVASEALMDLAATVVGARNGSRTSVAKSAASRENGRHGGRPRKAMSNIPRP